MFTLVCCAGKSAWGIELSKAVLEQECPDLLKDGFVEAGILTNLPYANNRSVSMHTLRCFAVQVVTTLRGCRAA